MSSKPIYAGLVKPAGPAPLFHIAGQNRARRVMNAWIDAQSIGEQAELDGRRTFHEGRVMRVSVFHRDGGREDVIRFQCQRDGTGAFGFSLDSLTEDRDVEHIERIILFRSLSREQKDRDKEVFQVYTVRKRAWQSWIASCVKNKRNRHVINVEAYKGDGCSISVPRVPDEEGDVL